MKKRPRPIELSRVPAGNRRRSTQEVLPLSTRVHELAKELGLKSQEFSLDRIQEWELPRQGQPASAPRPHDGGADQAVDRRSVVTGGRAYDALTPESSGEARYQLDTVSLDGTPAGTSLQTLPCLSRNPPHCFSGPLYRSTGLRPAATPAAPVPKSPPVPSAGGHRLQRDPAARRRPSAGSGPLAGPTLEGTPQPDPVEAYRRLRPEVAAGADRCRATRRIAVT